MIDGKQGVPFDRLLMRIKDGILIIGSLSSIIFAGYVAVIYIVRMNDRINTLEREFSELRVSIKHN